MSKTVPSLFAFALVAAPSVTALAGPSGFRCPDSGRVISLGDSQYDVRRKCGEPDDAMTKVEHRTVRERVRRWRDGVFVEEWIERTVEIIVDDWIFDFGRAKFTQYLRFEDRRLVVVREGERGID